MDKATEISGIFLREAKRQFHAGEISFAEYEEILSLIYNKLTDIETGMQKKNYVLETFASSNFKINLIDTINITLAMN